jgi:hypothetical protein
MRQRLFCCFLIEQTFRGRFSYLELAMSIEEMGKTVTWVYYLREFEVTNKTLQAVQSKSNR